MKTTLVGTALLLWSGAVLVGCASSPDIPSPGEARYRSSADAQRVAVSGTEAYCTDYGRVSAPTGVGNVGSLNVQCQNAGIAPGGNTKSANR
jgi:hypothetical protein